MEVGDLRLEDRRREERHDLRQDHAQHHAEHERCHGHEHGFEHHDDGNPSAPHTEDLVQAEFLFAALHDEVVGVDHQKRHHGRQEVREVMQDVAQKLGESLLGNPRDIDLHRDGVECVEHRDAQRQREQVHQVVPAGTLNVAQRELTEHRNPHHPSRRRPP